MKNIKLKEIENRVEMEKRERTLKITWFGLVAYIHGLKP